MADSELFLVSPAAPHEAAFCEMNDEYEREEGARFREYTDFASLLQLIGREAREPLRAGFVTASAFWLVNASGRIFGELRFRHYLNELLEHEGGHIGYNIRPLERGKGYGTLILQLALTQCRV